ncbi:LacI family DNA-binding transcriptional regulator [Cohnella sp. GCM10020058]|uniref:LacI family DNA-binding transcriptional regulator n=1 Tax=Cohnella sp. GCM10020058 TaxID=3317330 RepID=UPI00363FCEA1
MSKSVTVHDIAKLANVSSATVSRVLSNSNYPVSDKLRTRILKIAEEVSYVPNLLGKQLKKNSTMTIGIIIPSIINPFYSSVVFGVEEVARQEGFTVFACNSLQDPELEEEYIQTMMEKQVKGVIISSITTNKEKLKRLIEMNVNVIAIDQKLDEEGLSQIEFDHHKGGFLAAKYLQGKGHTRIGYATTKLNRPSRKGICRGYMDAMKEAGLEPLVEEYRSDEPFNPIFEFETGRELARRMMDADYPPTAIFACNDLLAFGVIHELRARGLQVPSDVSVMGFDGIDVGQMIHPPLTTIKQPDYEMGKMACRMLVDMTMGKDKPMFNVTLQPKLLERHSVRDLNG